MKLSSESIYNSLQPYFPFRKIYIAYSGGVDSHVLLHLCANIPAFSTKLVAIHVHHGLQASADAWAQHCQQIAQRLKVEFILQRVNARPDSGQSPEEVARDVRYQALAAVLEENDLLLVAQHTEDQYETIMLQMLRGAGLSGLSGMPNQMPLGKGLMLRPLLDVSKQAIQDYACQQALQWVEDDSNLSDDFDRNYLRNQITPLIKARWPSADKTISRAGRHCADAAQYLLETTESCFDQIYCPESRAVSISGLLAFDRYRQQLIIRHWFKVLSLRMPSTTMVQQILETIIPARHDADPQLHYQQGAVRRYRDSLYWQEHRLAVDKSQQFNYVLGQTVIILTNNGKLSISRSAQAGIDATAWQSAQVCVGYRQGGESIRLPGRAGSHSLKKLFQEMSMPPWQRSQIPLIYLDGQLAAIADQWIASEFYREQGNENIQLQWLI